MAKRCPMQNGRPVIYIDCAECEHKKECREKSKQGKSVISNKEKVTR